MKFSCLYAIEFGDKTWKVGGSDDTMNRLNSYKGPCKPMFCVIQLVQHYNVHESTLKIKTKKDDNVVF